MALPQYAIKLASLDASAHVCGGGRGGVGEMERRQQSGCVGMRRDREESWAEGRDVKNATAVVVHSNAVNLPNPC